MSKRTRLTLTIVAAFAAAILNLTSMPTGVAVGVNVLLVTLAAIGIIPPNLHEVPGSIGTGYFTTSAAKLVREVDAAARKKLVLDGGQHLRTLGDDEGDALVERYIEAWDRGDVDAVVAMLAQFGTAVSGTPASTYTEEAARDVVHPNVGLAIILTAVNGLGEEVARFPREPKPIYGADTFVMRYDIPGRDTWEYVHFTARLTYFDPTADVVTEETPIRPDDTGAWADTGDGWKN